MPTITASEIQDLTGTTMPVALIDKMIAMVISRSGDCLDANYPEDEANFIALMAAAAMVDISDSSSKIKSEKAANGASTTYQDRMFNVNSFQENQYGSQALAFDTNGCINALFPRTAGIRVSGQSLRP